MLRIALTPVAVALFCLLVPQTAFASPTLEWDGRAECMAGFVLPDIEVHGATGDRGAKDVAYRFESDILLRVGILATALGGIATLGAIVLFRDASETGSRTDEVLSNSFGGILLSLGAAAAIVGISMIINGAISRSKISGRALTGPDLRMARAEKNRARWGMRLALGGLP